MDKWSWVTGNIYFWFFIASFFLASALNSAVDISLGFLKRQHRRSGRLAALFFYLSAAITVVTVSVFVVNWKNVVWSMSVLWFILAFTLFFLVVTRYFFFAGLGIVVLFAGFIFYSGYILDSWCMADDGAVILKVRLLSENAKNNKEYKYEITDWKNNVSFYSFKGHRGRIVTYRVKVPKFFFYIPGSNYIYPELKGGGLDLEDKFYYKGIKFISSKLNKVLIYRETVDIPELRLLKSYSLFLNGGRIVLESSLLE